MEHVLATASINITTFVEIILFSSTCSVQLTCLVFSCEFCEVFKNIWWWMVVDGGEWLWMMVGGGGWWWMVVVGGGSLWMAVGGGG